MHCRPLVLVSSLFGFLVVAVSGCNGAKEEFHEAEKSAPVAEVEHEHDDGPHGGHIIELGDDEYHAEMVFDESTKKVTIYIAGADPGEKQAIEAGELTLNLMIDEKPVQLQLTANPEDDDPEGKSSRFELADNEIIKEHISDEEDLVGSINVMIDGKSFTGNIEHDHDHEHDDEHDDDHEADHNDDHEAEKQHKDEK